MDIQREECGFIDLELDAPENMIVDFAVGEHLADLRVRSSISGRLFSSRLITKNGKQRFTHYITRAAGRSIAIDGKVLAVPACWEVFSAITTTLFISSVLVEQSRN